jgi:hypothetical protein
MKEPIIITIDVELLCVIINAILFIDVSSGPAGSCTVALKNMEVDEDIAS